MTAPPGSTSGRDGPCREDHGQGLDRRSRVTGPVPTFGVEFTAPEPVHGGDLSELWDWINVVPEDDPCFAWLVSVLFPNIPHPILNESGEQGSGKSTAQKLLVSLVDPSPVPCRKPPKDPDSWVTAATGSWVVGLDNLSNIQDWLSDSLCRAVTGEGDVRRRLYTDGDLAVFAFKRCIILTGIDLARSGATWPTASCRSTLTSSATMPGSRRSRCGRGGRRPILASSGHSWRGSRG